MRIQAAHGRLSQLTAGRAGRVRLIHRFDAGVQRCVFGMHLGQGGISRRGRVFVSRAKWSWDPCSAGHAETARSAAVTTASTRTAASPSRNGIVSRTRMRKATLLVNGTDPFAAPGQAPSLSCRLYRDAEGRPGPAQSVEALRRALAAATDD